MNHYSQIFKTNRALNKVNKPKEAAEEEEIETANLMHVKNSIGSFQRSLPLIILEKRSNSLMNKYFGEFNIEHTVTASIKGNETLAKTIILYKESKGSTFIYDSFGRIRDYSQLKESYSNSNRLLNILHTSISEGNKSIRLTKLYFNFKKNLVKNNFSNLTTNFKINERKSLVGWISVTSNSMDIITDMDNCLGIIELLKEKRRFNEITWNILKEFIFLKILRIFFGRCEIDNFDAFLRILFDLLSNHKKRISLTVSILYNDLLFVIDRITISKINKLKDLEGIINNFEYECMVDALSTNSKITRYSFEEISIKNNNFDTIFKILRQFESSKLFLMAFKYSVDIQLLIVKGKLALTFTYKESNLLRKYLNRFFHPLGITIKQKKGVNFHKVSTRYSRSLGIKINKIKNVNQFSILINLRKLGKHKIELLDLIVKHCIIYQLYNIGVSPRQIRFLTHSDRIYHELKEISGGKEKSKQFHKDIINFFIDFNKVLINNIHIDSKSINSINWNSCIRNQVKNLNELLVNSLKSEISTNYQLSLLDSKIKALIQFGDSPLKRINNLEMNENSLKSVNDENKGATLLFKNYIMNSEDNPLSKVLNIEGSADEYIITDKYSVANCGTKSYWFGAPDILIIDRKLKRTVAFIHLKGKTLEKKRFTPQGIIYQILDLKVLEQLSNLKIAYVFIRDYSNDIKNPRILYQWYIITQQSTQFIRNQSCTDKEKWNLKNSSFDNLFHDMILNRIFRSKTLSRGFYSKCGKTTTKNKKNFTPNEIELFISEKASEIQQKILLATQLLEKHFNISSSYLQRIIRSKYENFVSNTINNLARNITSERSLGPYKTQSIWEQTILDASLTKFYNGYKVINTVD